MNIVYFLTQNKQGGNVKRENLFMWIDMFAENFDTLSHNRRLSTFTFVSRIIFLFRARAIYNTLYKCQKRFTTLFFDKGRAGLSNFVRDDMYFPCNGKRVRSNAAGRKRNG
jgi:hypothetical protein